MNKGLIYGVLLTILIIVLFVVNLFLGSVSIPASAVLDIMLGNEAENEAWKHIIIEYRLPQALTALFTGGAIAVSGLLLQTAFRNPLADPGILGISAGANLGVAIVVILLGGSFGIVEGLNISQTFLIILGAFIGACTILTVIMAFSSIVKNSLMLLIIGIMVGYLTSSAISILKFWGTSEKVYSFVLWGMGDFSNVSLGEIPLYCAIISVGLVLSILLIKPLNALLLGERYASNLGVNIKLLRFTLLFCAGLITAITCAYCGPISFIGLAVPHIARLILKTSNHKILIPATIMLGGMIALACNLISTLPGLGGIIPLNAITPIFGAPVIIYVIVNQKRIQYFS